MTDIMVSSSIWRATTRAIRRAAEAGRFVTTTARCAVTSTSIRATTLASVRSQSTTGDRSQRTPWALHGVADDLEGRQRAT